MAETPRGGQHRGTCCLKRWSFSVPDPFDLPHCIQLLKAGERARCPATLGALFQRLVGFARDQLRGTRAARPMRRIWPSAFAAELVSVRFSLEKMN